MENKYYERENVKCIKTTLLSDFMYQILKLNLLRISYKYFTQSYIVKCVEQYLIEKFLK